MNILGAHIPINHSDYRLISRRALDILEMYPEKLLFLRGFFHEVGLKSASVYFDVKPRMAGESKFNYASLMALALNGITSYSIVPLRMVAVLGFFMALIGFCVGGETVIEKIFWHNSPNGWATIVASRFSSAAATHTWEPYLRTLRSLITVTQRAWSRSSATSISPERMKDWDAL